MDKPINKLNFICKFAQTLGIGSKRINAFCARSGLNPFKVKVKTNARQNLRIKNLFNGVASSIFLRERYQRSYNFLWDNRFYKCNFRYVGWRSGAKNK